MHLIFILPVILSAFAIGLLAFFIKRTDWTAKKKKWMFTLTAAFLVFPVLVPAGTISALPMINAGLVVISIISLDIIDLLIWYGMAWKYSIPSFLITTLIFRGIAAMIFYEYKNE